MGVAQDVSVADDAPGAASGGVPKAVPERPPWGILETERLLLVVPVLLIVGLSWGKPLSDPDFWWHLRTGQLIWEQRAVPTTDPFSFTAAGREWVAHEWLWELITYGIWSQTGPLGVILCCALLLALTYCVLFRACRERCGDAPVAFALAFGGMLSFSALWSERPQLVTYLASTLFVLELERYRRRPTRRVWLLAPLIALWSNFHGGYFFGLTLVAVYSLGARFTDRGKSRTLWALLACCVVAATLNPHSVRALTYPLWYLAKPLAIDLVVEWMTPDFHQTRFLTLQIYLLGCVAVLAFSPRPLRLLDAGLFILLLRMSLFSARNVPLLAITCGPAVAEATCHALRSLQARAASTARPSYGIRAGVLALAVLFCLWRGHFFGRPLVNDRGFHPRAVGFLNAQQLGGSRLWVPYGLGGYAIWRLWPRYRVFFDGRADVYGDAVLRDHQTIAGAREGWDRLLRRYGVDVVLCDRKGPLNQVLRRTGGWSQKHTDSRASVFVRSTRRVPKHAAKAPGDRFSAAPGEQSQCRS